MSDHTPILKHGEEIWAMPILPGEYGYDEAVAQFRRMIEAVRAEEREKAAQIVETFQYSSDRFVTEVIAARIREQEVGG